jgi:hypothetical protein
MPDHQPQLAIDVIALIVSVFTLIVTGQIGIAAYRIAASTKRTADVQAAIADRQARVSLYHIRIGVFESVFEYCTNVVKQGADPGALKNNWNRTVAQCSWVFGDRATSVLMEMEKAIEDWRSRREPLQTKEACIKRLDALILKLTEEVWEEMNVSDSTAVPTGLARSLQPHLHPAQQLDK